MHLVRCLCQARGNCVSANNSGSNSPGDPSLAVPSTVFKYPYSELMLWAILLRRQQMAKFMWQMGDEALAKVLAVHSLVSCTAATIVTTATTTSTVPCSMYG